MSLETYALWDLIHDRAHSHGDLPFDPFMIRKRMPYWMYALEELRCDLTAFGAAVELEREGFGFARNVQYAILLDRMLRFPVTGARVRNYDGLAGQLLFAHLHGQGHVHWTDNRLSIDWLTVADGVRTCASASPTSTVAASTARSSRTGAPRTTSSRRCVPPATGSAWTAGRRSFADGDEPRAWIDQVADDEFPLSIFFTALRTAMAGVLTARLSTRSAGRAVR